MTGRFVILLRQDFSRPLPPAEQSAMGCRSSNVYQAAASSRNDGLRRQQPLQKQTNKIHAREVVEMVHS
jgi:hypothetical protein